MIVLFYCSVAKKETKRLRLPMLFADHHNRVSKAGRKQWNVFGSLEDGRY